MIHKYVDVEAEVHIYSEAESDDLSQQAYFIWHRLQVLYLDISLLSIMEKLCETGIPFCLNLESSRK